MMRRMRNRWMGAALAVLLLTAVALPAAAAVAPRDDARRPVEAWITDAWSWVVALVGASDGGPVGDPDGVTEAAPPPAEPQTGGGEQDGGPAGDPDG